GSGYQAAMRWRHSQHTVRFKQVKVPYPMPPAVDEKYREEFMAWAVKQNTPRIRAFKIGDESLTIVGYGPSLVDTWQKIKPPLIVTSRALKFLLEKGLKPEFGKWFYAGVDPRPNNLEFITPPHKDVIYLMGSVSYPKTWKLLRKAGVKVFMWHAISGEHTEDWVRQNDPGQILVGAGSTVGLCAVHLGGILGYRHFEIHGFDGCFRDGKRHAGEHSGHEQEKIEIEQNGRVFVTSKIMQNGNVEVQNMLKVFPIFCVFHGDGMVPNWVEHENLMNAAIDGTPKAETVRKTLYREVSREQAEELKEQGLPVLA
ncbi:MAG TPA: 6-hydroxymethylpterin diphosphokinase MptE-like protein, partial [Candidatus Binatus sp.]|nr:6-hydroxymethylpterin diphosphokinase MptE-like protein [Candidatus Binatus sp.]